MSRSPAPNVMPSYERLHGLWSGCGDLFDKAADAIQEVRKLGVQLTFTDIIPRENLPVQPPAGTRFFNVSDPRRRGKLREYLHDKPLTHIYIANWPSIHLLTAFRYLDSCPGGAVIISKPLDTNFDLIETTGVCT